MATTDGGDMKYFMARLRLVLVRTMISSLGVFCATAMLPAALAQTNKPTNLRCDDLTQPLGIDSQKPMLSWRLQDESRGAKQTAYQIFVSSNLSAANGTKPDVWDSGT